jgi:general secretion pathway protein M
MFWYNKLTLNEQKLLKTGILILLPVLFWTLLYLPLNKSIEIKTRQKSQLTGQYQEMLLAEDELKIQNTNSVKFYRDLNKPFITWIDEQLAKNQLSQYVTRSEPKDSTTLILTFESVVFDELIVWLEPLELQYQVKISEVDVNIIDRNNGLCNARITLEENK